MLHLRRIGCWLPASPFLTWPKSVAGRKADITLLKDSQLLEQLPDTAFDNQEVLRALRIFGRHGTQAPADVGTLPRALRRLMAR